MGLWSFHSDILVVSLGRCDSRTGDSHSPSYTEPKKTTLRQRAGRGPAGLERPSWGWRRGRGAEAACAAASPSGGREAGECGCRKSADGSRHPRAHGRSPRVPAAGAPARPRLLPSFLLTPAIGALGPSLCAGPHCPERLVDATMRVLSPVCCARPPHCPSGRARRSAGQGGPRLSRGIGRPAPATCRSSVFKFSESPAGALVSDCGSNAHFLNG